jgi:hypothetical protein
MVHFQTKNHNLGNFWGPCNGRGWQILWPFGLFYGHLWPFGIIVGYLVYFSPVLVSFTEKTLATLFWSRRHWRARKRRCGQGNDLKVVSSNLGGRVEALYRKNYVTFVFKWTIYTYLTKN